jgi:hypothetical protein
VSLTEETLRMEGGQPVAGYVVLAQRPVPIGSVGFAAAQHVT